MHEVRIKKGILFPLIGTIVVQCLNLPSGANFPGFDGILSLFGGQTWSMIPGCAVTVNASISILFHVPTPFLYLPKWLNTINWQFCFRVFE